ncbi:transposase [Cystobacter fuscus]|uniref:transposase n=1 Tax=Cystobacter fuscus TaxID=43 RepID=UPI001FE22565|nr:transposase [Cystobacter fuscus]
MVTQPETGPACVVVCEWDVERPGRYGARGALALERLSRAEDGRIAYQMKRPLPDGTTHLLFTGLELLRRVASLVPPPRANLTRFHGVFAPGARLRPFQVPQAGEEEASVAPQAAARQETRKERRARVDWAGLLRRTFAVEVLACERCGGRRRVLAYVNEAGGVRALLEHLGLAPAGARLAPARGPPRPRGVEAYASPEPKGPVTYRAPHASAAWAVVYLKGLRGLSTRLAHCSGGPCPRSSSAPALQPSPSTWPLSRLYAELHSDVEAGMARPARIEQVGGVEHVGDGDHDDRCDDGEPEEGLDELGSARGGSSRGGDRRCRTGSGGGGTWCWI